MSIRYSVIIPSYNRAHQLILTLSSYAAQTYNKNKFEVIVVDDGSTDNTAEVVREFSAPFKLRYIANETRESAAVARNRGASLARGKYLIFNDADFLVYPHFIDVIRTYHKHHKRAVISPWPYNARGVFTHYYPNFEDDVEKSFQSALRHAGIDPSVIADSSRVVPIVTPHDVLHNLYKVKKLRNWAPNWALGSHIKKVAQQTDVAPFYSFITRCIALPKDDFDAVGGFCEEFKDWGLEDQELGYRLHKRGVPYVCLRTRIGLHQEHPVSLKADNAVERNLALWFRRAGFNDLELSMQFMIDPWDPAFKDKLRAVAKHRNESEHHRNERHSLRRHCRTIAKARISMISKPDDTRKLRIYFYSECLGGQGGMETVLSTVCTGLMNRGHDVRIILDGPSWDPTWESGLPIIHLANNREQGDRLSLLRATLNRNLCPDVIVTMEAWQTAVARKAVKNFSPRPSVVSWVHFSPHIRVRDNPQWVEQMNSADAHIAICRGVADQLKELTPSVPTHQVYNPVTSTSETIPMAPTPTFLYMGRLFNYQKRIDRILTALSAVCGEWRLKIIGDGQDAQPLRDLASQLGINDRIDWFGWQRKPWDAVESATCLVMSSDYEGYGMVAVEALSRGIPVVLADCPTGPNEIVQPGVNGWLFPPEDNAALKEILEAVVCGNLPLPSPDTCKSSVPQSDEKVILDQFESVLFQYRRH